MRVEDIRDGAWRGIDGPDSDGGVVGIIGAAAGLAGVGSNGEEGKEGDRRETAVLRLHAGRDGGRDPSQRKRWFCKSQNQ